MIRKFDLGEVRGFLLYFTKGADDVFVSPGTIAQLLPAVGLDPSTFIVPSKPKLYGLSVKEIPAWDITLVGRAEQVDDVAGSEDLLFQAYLIAYPVCCPSCGRKLQINACECGGDKDRRWEGVCFVCGKIHLVSGREVVFLPAEADTKPEETWRDRPPLL